ncbi:MAG: hypothetical protein WC921_04145 [Candidatus Paceibacterota bacterium]|jgi:hypothetical protein
MENKTVPVSAQPILLLPAPRDAETFDVHVSYGIYSLFSKRTFFKGERGKKGKIKKSVGQEFIEFLKNNCRESRKVAERIEKDEAEKKLLDFEIKNSKCGFVQYQKPEEMARWNAKENYLEEKTADGCWAKSELLDYIRKESRGKQRIRSLIKGLQAILIADIGDVKYSYLAVTNPESAYIGLESKGKEYYDKEKLKKIFFGIDLLKALAAAVGYDHRNIPAPDALLMKWFW